MNDSARSLRGVARPVLDGSQLKLIAVFTMAVDHAALLLLGRGYLIPLVTELRELARHGTDQPLYTTLYASYTVWMSVYRLMRTVGRIAFPIYAFLLAEGFFHTRNWRRYAARLGLFALLSEVPFDLLTTSQVISMDAQNVFLTMLFGLLMMKGMETASQWREAGPLPGPAPVRLSGMAVPAAFALVSWYLRTDYDYSGILLIAIFYFFRNERPRGCLAGFLWMAFNQNNWYYLPGYAVSFGLIWLYNGERGRQPWKYAFYLFYPVHMLVLYGIYKYAFPGLT